MRILIGMRFALTANSLRDVPTTQASSSTIRCTSMEVTILGRDPWAPCGRLISPRSAILTICKAHPSIGTNLPFKVSRSQAHFQTTLLLSTIRRCTCSVAARVSTLTPLFTVTSLAAICGSSPVLKQPTTIKKTYPKVLMNTLLLCMRTLCMSLVVSLMVTV